MVKLLPSEVELRFCDQSRELSGLLATADMPRLCELLSDNEAHIDIALSFGVSDGFSKRKIKFVKGVISATLNLLCQRCLEPMEWKVDRILQLGLLEHELAEKPGCEKELDELPERYEPFFVEQGLVSIVSMVEQELILALPLIAKHEIANCSVQDDPIQLAALHGDDQVVTPKENAFSVLKDLKVKSKD